MHPKLQTHKQIIFHLLYLLVKKEKTKLSKFDEFIMKVNIKCFSFNDLPQDIKIVKNVI